VTSPSPVADLFVTVLLFVAAWPYGYKNNLSSHLWWRTCRADRTLGLVWNPEEVPILSLCEYACLVWWCTCRADRTLGLVWTHRKSLSSRFVMTPALSGGILAGPTVLWALSGTQRKSLSSRFVMTPALSGGVLAGWTELWDLSGPRGSPYPLAL